jgi:hypothetical protein
VAVRASSDAAWRRRAGLTDLFPSEGRREAFRRNFSCYAKTALLHRNRAIAALHRSTYINVKKSLFST